MPTAREGGSANNAGAIICRPLGKAEVQICREQKSAKTIIPERAPTSPPGNVSGLHRWVFSLDYRVKPDNDGTLKVRHSSPGPSFQRKLESNQPLSRPAGHDR
ncbi:hypothetical protein [Candidatus Spongiihabitans sp.]|uniref:hypothetical protein n=1 Tax=Candidatus Spongiihabitans sp. TaxID=3101308 RepID=UPI003C7CDC69